MLSSGRRCGFQKSTYADEDGKQGGKKNAYLLLFHTLPMTISNP
jgi:hypothetical protein